MKTTKQVEVGVCDVPGCGIETTQYCGMCCSDMCWSHSVHLRIEFAHDSSVADHFGLHSEYGESSLVFVVCETCFLKVWPSGIRYHRRRREEKW